MQAEHTTLTRLTRLCLYGYEFYCEAAAQVDNALLRQYFLKAARIKSDFVRDIDARIGLVGRGSVETDPGNAWLDTVSAAYDDSYHLFDSLSLPALISRLTRAEEYLCEGFRAALTETESAAVRDTLLLHLIRLQETQDFLKSLKDLDFVES